MHYLLWEEKKKGKFRKLSPTVAVQSTAEEQEAKKWPLDQVPVPLWCWRKQLRLSLPGWELRRLGAPSFPCAVSCQPMGRLVLLAFSLVSWVERCSWKEPARASPCLDALRAGPHSSSQQVALGEIRHSCWKHLQQDGRTEACKSPSLHPSTQKES